MNQEKIGRFIAAERKAQHLTQEQLGAALGVTNRTVSRWETGKYMPDLSLLQPLAAQLGVSVNELLSGERLDDPAHFAQKADENLVQALSASAFTWRDRLAFYKKKWCRDHIGLILCCVLLWCAALALCVIYQPLLLALLPLPTLFLYGALRNQMMIYAESRAFLPQSEAEQPKVAR